MNKFIKTWNGKQIDDWGYTCSDEFKSFTRQFKNALKRTFPDCEIIGFKANHYDFSGFLKKGDKYVYISYSEPREQALDMSRSDCSNGILYRAAKHEKDYTGGHNHFCNFFELEQSVNEMFERVQKEMMY